MRALLLLVLGASCVQCVPHDVIVRFVNSNDKPLLGTAASRSALRDSLIEHALETHAEVMDLVKARAGKSL